MPSRPPVPPETPPPASAAILPLPEATASVLYGLSDLLHSAGRDWGLIVEGRPGTPLVAPRIVAARSEPFTIANGVTIVADAPLQEAERPDLVCIPELLIAPRLSHGRQSHDALIARCQAWAVTGFRERSPVAAMARLTNLSERTLVRRFQQAIAGALGYEDPRFFVRLFQHEVKLTPSQYRRKFGQMRAVLQTARQD